MKKILILLTLFLAFLGFVREMDIIADENIR